MNATELKNIEQRLTDTEDILKKLNAEDIAVDKIVTQAKSKFTNWLTWSLVGITISYVGGINGLVNTPHTESERETIKQEILAEMKGVENAN